jgi:hypothetical protein
MKLSSLFSTPKGKMTNKTPSSAAERRLAIARTIFQALATQEPHRAITLCDGSGEVVAQHDPRPEQNASEIAPFAAELPISSDGTL